MMSLQRAMGQMIWVQTSLALARLVILPRPPSVFFCCTDEFIYLGKGYCRNRDRNEIGARLDLNRI